MLVACEYSGVVRDAFLARGHDAVSADLLPTESPGPHLMGDVRPQLRRRWDLVIAHPPCTYLCNSGVRWLHRDEAGREVPRGTGRWVKMQAAAEFFLACFHANAPRVAVENPTMHKYAIAALGGLRPTCAVQPWEHGHGETKRTCFWTRGLPPLMPTDVVTGRVGAVHVEPPGPDRGKIRSKTYRGIAEAMAEQWG